ncbi:MAG: putative toxin-antitoxin system toxin component, PIN family [Saccharofermentanales bacterium]|nr:putative toxin-antitoxin system toxin component, PIN family [Bacillota bacterium]NLB08108.1 putative toxin-antitoxin system toxin component, PIN family [Clostridiales bacterium]
MKILVDTNILISAILFPASKPAEALLKVSEEHELVLCEQNLRELREVIRRKEPEYSQDVEVLLVELAYELIPDSYYAEKLIRDPKNQPILNAAILANVDLLITGDKDFLVLELEQPHCITAAQFLENY